MPQGMQLRIETVEDKQVAMIAPTTMTPHGTTSDERRQHGHLGNEQRRISCPNPQEVEESTLHTFQHGLSYSSWPTGKLQEDSRKATWTTTTHCHWFLPTHHEATAEQTGRRQAWIGETWFKPKATARPVTTTMPNTTAKAIEAEHKAKTTTATPQEHTAEAQQPRNRKHQQQDIQASKRRRSQPFQYNRSRQDQWLLDQRRSVLETRACEPRTTYYVPTQSDGGPNYDNLLPTRMTMVYPTNGSRGKRVDDNWTAEPQPEEPTQWTGSTKLWGKAQYKEQLESDDEEHQPAIRAKAATTPYMPTPQEVQEHNLTHLPYRELVSNLCSWQRTNNKPSTTTQQTTVVQVDFAYIQAHMEKPTPVLTAVDVQTGLCMAAMIPDKQQLFDHATTCLQTFLLECGRTEAILQSDQKTTWCSC